MAATQRGLAVIYGAAGFTTTAGIVSATTKAQNQSGRFTRSSDKAEIRDGNGEVAGQVFYNAKKSHTITVVPHGDQTASTAITSLDAWLAAPGTKITVVDTGSVMDGDYNLISGTCSRTNTDAATVEIEIERYEANDVTATVS